MVNSLPGCQWTHRKGFVKYRVHAYGAKAAVRGALVDNSSLEVLVWRS